MKGQGLVTNKLDKLGNRIPVSMINWKTGWFWNIPKLMYREEVGKKGKRKTPMTPSKLENHTLTIYIHTHYCQDVSEMIEYNTH